MLTDLLLHSALTDCSVEQTILITRLHTRMHARFACLSRARTRPHRGGAGSNHSRSKCCSLPTIKSSHQSMWHVTKRVAKALAIKEATGARTLASSDDMAAPAAHQGIMQSCTASWLDPCSRAAPKQRKTGYLRIASGYLRDSARRQETGRRRACLDAIPSKGSLSVFLR